MFGFWSNFFDNLKWNAIPDILSLISGRFLKDTLGEGRTELFAFVCIGIYVIQLIVISHFL